MAFSASWEARDEPAKAVMHICMAGLCLVMNLQLKFLIECLKWVFEGVVCRQAGEGPQWLDSIGQALLDYFSDLRIGDG